LLDFWAKQRKTLILIFIAAYIYVVNAYWLGGHWVTGRVSKNPTCSEQFYSPSLLLSNFFGFSGSRWTVFSPNVVHLGHYIYVTILGSNQTVQIWTYPCSGRYVKYGETFRKYSNHSTTVNTDRMLMADLVRYVARLYESPSFHPVELNVIRRIEVVPPPRRALTAHKLSKEEVLFTYNLSPDITE
jgi:hypothetical protein